MKEFIEVHEIDYRRASDNGEWYVPGIVKDEAPCWLCETSKPFDQLLVDANGENICKNCHSIYREIEDLALLAADALKAFNNGFIPEKEDLNEMLCIAKRLCNP